VEPLVTYEFAHCVATITMDDGKVNVMSIANAIRVERRARYVEIADLVDATSALVSDNTRTTTRTTRKPFAFS
jgi:hypothetical protein